jgi:hypothetical protein
MLFAVFIASAMAPPAPPQLLANKVLSLTFLMRASSSSALVTPRAALRVVPFCSEAISLKNFSIFFSSFFPERLAKPWRTP